MSIRDGEHDSLRTGSQIMSNGDVNWPETLLSGTSSIVANLVGISHVILTKKTPQGVLPVENYGFRSLRNHLDLTFIQEEVKECEGFSILKKKPSLQKFEELCGFKIGFAGSLQIADHDHNVFGYAILLDSEIKNLTLDQSQSLFTLRDQWATLLKYHNQHLNKRETSEENDSLLDSLGEGVLEIDENGTPLYANQKSLTMLGIQPNELSSVSIWDYVAEIDLLALKKFYTDQFRKESASCYFECRLNPPNSEIFWVGISSTMLYEGKRMVRLRSVIRNLSENKTLRKELEWKESLYELVSQNSTDLISLHEDVGKFLFISVSVEDILGFAPLELLGKSLLTLIHKQDRGIFQNALEKARTGEILKPIRYRVRTKKKHYIWLESIVKPIYDEKKNVSSIQISSKDITKIKLEEDRKIKFLDGLYLLNLMSSKEGSLEDILQESLNQVTRYFNLETGLICKLQNNRFRVLNHYSEEMEKVPSSMIAEDTYCKLALDSGGELFVHDMSKSKFKNESCFKKFGWKTFSGEIIYRDDAAFGSVSVSSKRKRQSSFNNYEREFMRLYANWVGSILKRIEERKLLEKARKKALRASREKAKFLSTMSHEIRTPLNGIIGATHLLLKKNPREDQNMHFEILSQSGNNLLAIVNDILDFDRIEDGMLEIENSPFNLRELAKIIHVHYQLQAENNVKIELTYDQALNDFYIGDSVRIGQVLHNLMSNSLKFTERGSIRLSLFKRAHHDEHDEIHVDVSDTGVGIPKNKLNSVFNDFVQASSNGNMGGSGLGLAISKRLIELMDSKIQVESAIGEGSSFSFNLILRRSRSSDLVNTPKMNMQYPLINGRVLVVEDNKFNRLIANDFLISWGCEVIEAENGAQAMKLLNQDVGIDLVLLDLQMPVLDGFETAERIRKSKNEKINSIPILGLTASAQTDTMAKAYKCGMNNFITKPFRPDEVHKKISELLGLSRQGLNTDHLISDIFVKLQKTAGNDENKISRYLNVFLETMIEEAVQLEKAVKSKNIAEIKSYCHKNKTTLRLVGLNEQAKSMEEIEGMILNQNLKSMIIQKSFKHLKEIQLLIHSLKNSKHYEPK